MGDIKLIGLDRQLQQLEDWIKSWEEGHPTKKAVILYGPPGCGKTESAYYIAKKYGYEVVEFNASDERTREFFNELIKVVRMHSFTKTLILLDEADGIENMEGLRMVVEKTRKPIVMTCNDISKINQRVRELCAIIYYPRPRVTDLVKVGKVRNGIVDFRQAKLAEFGSEGYNPTPISQREKFEMMFRSGDYRFLRIPDDLPMLLDIGVNVFYGLKLYFFIRYLSLVDMTYRKSLLNGFRVIKKIEVQSYFLERLKVLKERGEI